MINGRTKIYGLLGRPVSHSLSPAMHNAAFREKGVNAVYVAFPVSDLHQAVAGLRGLGIGGASVTIPFKEEIIPLLDRLDPKAAAIGAVNTVVVQEEGLIGYNTDWVGAVAALQGQTVIQGEHFLILGAGGAARAIAYGLKEKGGRVSLTDIEPERAETLAREMGGEAFPLTALKDCPARVLINATPVGMAPHSGKIPIEADLLEKFTLVMDIVYRPLNTRLLREAQSRNCRTIDGLAMLIYQATAQFYLFTGLPAPVPTMSQAAYAALQEEGE
ncbi:MAG: shikimate dehydrogenase [Thermodesulfobacteriota bacterium]